MSRSSLSDIYTLYSLIYISWGHFAKNKYVLWSNLSLPAQRLRFALMSQTACRQPAPTTWRQSVSSPRAQPAAGSPSTKQHSSIIAKKHRRKVEGQPPTHAAHSRHTQRSYSQRLLPQQTAAFIIPLCMCFTFTSVLVRRISSLMNNMGICQLQDFGLKNEWECISVKYIL